MMIVWVIVLAGQYMKAVNRLRKEFSTTRILTLVDQEEIEQYFASLDGEEGLQTVDPEIVEIVLEQLEQKPQTQLEEKPIKMDILTLGARELMTACRDENLITLFEYISGIKNFTWQELHSYYGLKLLHYRPEKYFLGKKSTHFHCNTTARRIQQEYGIFREASEDERSNDQERFRNEADEEFIAKESNSDNDNEEAEAEADQDDENEPDEEESPIQIKRSKKQQKQEKRNKMSLESQSDQPAPTQQRKKKMQLQSDSEMHPQSGSANPTKKGQTPSKQTEPEDERILSILSALNINKILGCFTYQQLFEYLLEHRQNKLLSLLDIQQVQLAVITHRGTKKSEKKLSSGRKLVKAKVNVKTLTLEQLIDHCRDQNLKQVAKINSIDLLTTDDHLKFSKLLLTSNSKKYIMQGPFSAYPDAEVNQTFEQIYQQDQDAEQDDEDEDDDASSNIVVNDSASIESEQDELDRAEALFRKKRR